MRTIFAQILEYKGLLIAENRNVKVSEMVGFNLDLLGFSGIFWDLLEFFGSPLILLDFRFLKFYIHYRAALYLTEFPKFAT